MSEPTRPCRWTRVDARPSARSEPVRQTGNEGGQSAAQAEGSPDSWSRAGLKGSGAWAVFAVAAKWNAPNSAHTGR